MNSTIDHTLYAGWTANTYTVTFDYNIPDSSYYMDGKIVYFNPTTGLACKQEEAISSTGTKSGCMKWHAFLDNENN